MQTMLSKNSKVNNNIKEAENMKKAYKPLHTKLNLQAAMAEIGNPASISEAVEATNKMMEMYSYDTHLGADRIGVRYFKYNGTASVTYQGKTLFTFKVEEDDAFILKPHRNCETRIPEIIVTHKKWTDEGTDYNNLGAMGPGHVLVFSLLQAYGSRKKGNEWFRHSVVDNIFRVGNQLQYKTNNPFMDQFNLMESQYVVTAYNNMQGLVQGWANFNDADFDACYKANPLIANANRMHKGGGVCPVWFFTHCPITTMAVEQDDSSVIIVVKGVDDERKFVARAIQGKGSSKVYRPVIDENSTDDLSKGIATVFVTSDQHVGIDSHTWGSLRFAKGSSVHKRIDKRIPESYDLTFVTPAGEQWDVSTLVGKKKEELADILAGSYAKGMSVLIRREADGTETDIFSWMKPWVAEIDDMSFTVMPAPDVFGGIQVEVIAGFAGQDGIWGGDKFRGIFNDLDVLDSLTAPRIKTIDEVSNYTGQGTPKSVLVFKDVESWTATGKDGNEHIVDLVTYSGFDKDPTNVGDNAIELGLHEPGTIEFDGKVIEGMIMKYSYCTEQPDADADGGSRCKFAMMKLDKPAYEFLNRAVYGPNDGSNKDREDSMDASIARGAEIIDAFSGIVPDNAWINPWNVISGMTLEDLVTNDNMVGEDAPLTFTHMPNGLPLETAITIYRKYVKDLWVYPMVLNRFNNRDFNQQDDFSYEGKTATPSFRTLFTLLKKSADTNGYGVTSGQIETAWRDLARDTITKKRASNFMKAEANCIEGTTVCARHVIKECVAPDHLVAIARAIYGNGKLFVKTTRHPRQHGGEMELELISYTEHNKRYPEYAMSVEFNTAVCMVPEWTMNALWNDGDGDRLRHMIVEPKNNAQVEARLRNGFNERIIDGWIAGFVDETQIKINDELGKAGKDVEEMFSKHVMGMFEIKKLLAKIREAEANKGSVAKITQAFLEIVQAMSEFIEEDNAIARVGKGSPNTMASIAKAIQDALDGLKADTNSADANMIKSIIYATATSTYTTLDDGTMINNEEQFMEMCHDNGVTLTVALRDLEILRKARNCGFMYRYGTPEQFIEFNGNLVKVSGGKCATVKVGKKRKTLTLWESYVYMREMLFGQYADFNSWMATKVRALVKNIKPMTPYKEDRLICDAALKSLVKGAGLNEQLLRKGSPLAKALNWMSVDNERGISYMSISHPMTCDASMEDKMMAVVENFMSDGLEDGNKFIGNIFAKIATYNKDITKYAVRCGADASTVRIPKDIVGKLNMIGYMLIASAGLNYKRFLSWNDNWQTQVGMHILVSTGTWNGLVDKANQLFYIENPSMLTPEPEAIGVLTNEVSEELPLLI